MTTLNPVAKQYLRCVADIGYIYERAKARDPMFFVTDQKVPGIMLPLMRRARLFDLSAAVYDSVARRVSSGELVGTPDLNQLPFDVCWFGSHDAADNHQMMITRSGWLLLIDEDKVGWKLNCVCALDDDGWETSAIDMAWSATLLAQIATTRGIKERPASVSVRRLMDKAGKHRPEPPELYTLNMNARQAGHAVGHAVTPHAGPGYRFEVAGHPRLLVRRGRWPDEDHCKAWATAGYEVFHGSVVPNDWRVTMDLRGVAPPTDKEWIALRIVNVKSHEKGPDGTVIRATRVTM